MNSIEFSEIKIGKGSVTSKLTSVCYMMSLKRICETLFYLFIYFFCFTIPYLTDINYIINTIDFFNIVIIPSVSRIYTVKKADVC